MAIAVANRIVEHLRQTMLLREGKDVSDARLLECFIQHRDSTAFSLLVSRHGALVMGVCQRVLGNYHDAEDAFQATFLVLARKADQIKPRELLANWLFGVAFRAAAKARTANARRCARERQVKNMPEPIATRSDEIWRDLRPVIDRELCCMPDYYRAAVVLCDLQGRTGKDAARELGCAEGTLHSRLARGRQLLAKRLRRRGLSISGFAVAAILAEGIGLVHVSPTCASAAVQAALCNTPHALANGLVSTQAVGLAHSVVRDMFLTKVKAAASPFAAAFGSIVLLCTIGTVLRPTYPGSLASAFELRSEAASSPERGGSEQPAMDDGFITKPGEYHLFGGDLIVRVWGEKDRWRWNASFPQGTKSEKTTLGSAKPQLTKGSPWFVYPISKNVVWCYEPENKRVILIKQQSPGNFVMKDADIPANWKSVLEIEEFPKKAAARLPRNLRPATRGGR
jgi:RNA polymerase sigma factor (sigma-70 family)